MQTANKIMEGEKRVDIKALGLPENTVKKLISKKICDTADILDAFLPKQYIDLKKPNSLIESVGQKALLKLNVLQIKPNISTDTIRLVGRHAEGQLVTITWFRQSYIYNDLLKYQHNDILVYGKVAYSEQWGYQINTPDYLCFANNSPAVYVKRKHIAGISDEMIGRAVLNSIAYATETLPLPVLNESGISAAPTMYKGVHFPQSMEEAQTSHDEYVFRELYKFALELKKTYPSVGKGKIIKDTNGLEEKYLSSLPYKPTRDQQSAIEMIDTSISSGNQLRLLVQGDVGCGKTTVAFALITRTVSAGYQVALLAPTTVLARQHYEALKNFFAEDEIAYLSSEQTASIKKAEAAKIKSGAAKVVVGTHAVFSSTIDYKNLAVIIVDEEHKFGVAQREKLKAKALEGVHIVSMSATPIPRSLAAVLYGEACEVTCIRSMPDGRKPIKTALCTDRSKLVKHLLKELQNGHQAYVVCPRVEIDEITEKESVIAAAAEYEKLVAPYKVGILHGKMKKEEIAQAIDDFRKNKTQVLVSTTVVEVGVNVPNATCIIIESAEMFGLSSLHQLRGRVGRGDDQGYCILVSKEAGNNERLNILSSTTDGFEIAEADLKLRGTGNIVGLEQSGFNREVALMINNPSIYTKAAKVAAFAIEKGLASI